MANIYICFALLRLQMVNCADLSTCQHNQLTSQTNVLCCQCLHAHVLHCLKPGCYMMSGSQYCRCKLFDLHRSLHHHYATLGQHCHSSLCDHHIDPSVYTPFQQPNKNCYHDNVSLCTCIAPVQLLLLMLASCPPQQQ